MTGEASMGPSMVAIVGRPNVGKSTLFNRLVGASLAVVEDIPGVTRDRHYSTATALGREYMLVDTGGFDPEGEDVMAASIAKQVRIAVEECDLVICVLDASCEPLGADREAVQMLRAANKPTLYVANKADTNKVRHQAFAHHELGLDELFPISALHGHGVGDLEEAIAKRLPARDEEHAANEDEEVAPRIAIVGRPNAGKSSLINRLLKEERQLVDSRPGTTTDAIDSEFEYRGSTWILTDTAGIRRKRAVQEGVEALSVLQALRAVERSHVAVLMIDAVEGAAEQDARLAGLLCDRGRGVVIGLNKMDLLSVEEQKKAVEHTREIFAFASWAPIIKVSAATGAGMQKLLSAVHSTLQEHRKRVPTGEINRFFVEVLERHPPPTVRSKPVRLYYVTQARVAPPTFYVFTNEPHHVHFSYQRYVVNQIRNRFGFEGTPLRVFYRPRNNRAEKT